MKYSVALKICLLFLFASSCKQSYNPPATDTDLRLLVVDGFLNNSTDTTFIRLTRTAKLRGVLTNKSERNAQMTVEEANGNVVYNFQESGTIGTYYVPGMQLDLNTKYLLRIATNDGSQYLSDEIEVKNTPPIDSIGWRRTDEGIQIYSNTHDPLSNTKYYRWDYTETWEYLSNFFSDLKYENHVMEYRTFPQDQVFRCWQTRNSTNLLLGTSAKLSEDVIYMNPIQFIPFNSIELNVRYSIFVRQYALTKEAFAYLENLKKNTEQLGSIFDPQPSELPTNIHCLTNPAEQVIGFATASNMQTKRIFIEKVQVLPWNYIFPCYESRSFSTHPDTLEIYFGSGTFWLPIEEIRVRGILIAYNGGVAECVSCELRGGNTIKPDFWP